MDFRWQTDDDGRWVLTPLCDWIKGCISVYPYNGYWIICVGIRPLNSRYTSEQGAKLDAWEYAKSMSRVYFNANRICLVA